MNNSCPLCYSEATVFYTCANRIYYQCNHCQGLFLDEGSKLDKESEKSRYLSHQNNVDDKGYQDFVLPITSAVRRDFTSDHLGLDFGAGTGPVISKVLTDNNFTIKQFDPFFHHYPELLDNRYDFIVCCEVIEHFYTPKKEFSLLKNLLNKGGRLYCMTNLFDETIDFHHWYYKNDATHVFFYHRQSLQYIKNKFGFSDINIEDRLITFIA